MREKIAYCTKKTEAQSTRTHPAGPSEDREAPSAIRTTLAPELTTSLLAGGAAVMTCTSAAFSLTTSGSVKVAEGTTSNVPELSIYGTLSDILLPAKLRHDILPSRNYEN